MNEPDPFRSTDAAESEHDPSTPGRPRYVDSHWAREADRNTALEQYLRLGARPYNRTKFQQFVRLAGDVRGKTILDYGGGAGILAIPYAKAGARVVLVDAEANALNTARFYAEREGVADRVQTIQAEVVPAAVRAERFDIVIAKDIVEHIVEDEQVLRDLSACQREGGTLLLSTQNRNSLNYLIEGTYQRRWLGNQKWCGWDSTHVRFYSASMLRRRLENAGYRTDRWAGVYIIPYDILSWLFLMRVRLETPALRYFDLTMGRVFPFNRWGWNIIVRGTKT
jgi:2-polyprenyl-6-hydroxyphenyl methylase/3-demethylubiquinone-9 3-methyltransferase